MENFQLEAYLTQVVIITFNSLMQCSYFDDFEQMKWKLVILKIEKGARDKAIKPKRGNPVVQGPVATRSGTSAHIPC